MLVNEIFPAIQGEGTLIGTPQVFVRTSGCNMHCSYCDSRYSWHEGKEMTIDEVVEEVESYGLKSVCLTGGEPTLQKDSTALCHALQERGYYVSVQTNGSQWSDLLDIADKVCADMKPPQMNFYGNLIYSNLSLIHKLDYIDEVKVLIGSEDDIKYAHLVNSIASERDITTILQPYNDTQHDSTKTLIWKYQWIVDGLKEYNFKPPYRVLPQLHVLIWGNQRRK